MSAALVLPRPAQRIAIVCPGFAADRVRRQPWHVADGLARGLAAAGHAVWIVSDQSDLPRGVAYGLATVPRLFAGGKVDPGLRRHLGELGLDRLFLVTGMSRLARLPRLDLGAPTTLIMASPRLRLGELARLGPLGLWRERSVLALPLLNALLPAWLLRRGYARSGAEDIVYLSPSARERFAAVGLPLGRLLVPRIDRSAIVPAVYAADGFTVAYFGPPLATRGADLAIDAVEQASAAGLDVRLLLLLRPDGEAAAMERLLARVAKSPIRQRIDVRTEMLSAPELRRELGRASAFLLPFRVTVSEVPLVVIEACLSGRPTIVLDAPGVGDIGRKLGAIVASSPAALPEALARAAARSGELEARDAGPWTDWPSAARTLVQPRGEPFAAWRMIALAGVDGSGKTFLLQHLAQRLDAAGIPHRHVWSRFRNYLSKPLLALARLTGHNRKEEVNGVRIGYHAFAGHSWLAWPFLVLQLIDGAIDAWWRYGRVRDRRLVLADRCLYDTLVDLAADTGLDDVIFGPVGRWLLRRLPAPRLVVVLSRPVADIAASRPDALLDRQFWRRRALYERLARELALPVLENTGSPESLLDALERLAATSPVRGASS